MSNFKKRDNCFLSKGNPLTSSLLLKNMSANNELQLNPNEVEHSPSCFPDQLQHTENKNQPIPTSNCLDEVVRSRVLSKPRDIRLTANNYNKIIDELSAELVNLESTQPGSKLEIHLNLNSRTLKRLGSEQRTDIIQRFLSRFGKHIIGISLMIHDEDVYLLEEPYHLPHLRSLDVDSPQKGGFPPGFDIASKVSTQILEDLLIVYGGTLKTLEISGILNINMDGSKYYPVHVLETVSINRSMSKTVQSVIVLSGLYISTLELHDIMGEEANGDECYLPNLKNLYIDADSMNYFELVRCNARNLESLILFCDDPLADFYPKDLPEFKNLKLLEVNCSQLNTAILQRCTESLEYLYVPERDDKTTWKDVNMNKAISLPALKDLCVPGSKRWSINMIKKNCNSLEILIVFDFIEMDVFLRVNDDDEDFYSDEDEEEEGEYCWPDLANINCRFPNLKMLLLPGCTDSYIVESLASKCPPNVQVVTDKKLVGEAVKARIYECYAYTRYKKMMHLHLSGLFQLREGGMTLQQMNEEMEGLPSIADVKFNQLAAQQ